MRELEGMLPVKRKKLQAEETDNLQSMKEISEGERSTELIFKNSLKYKKKFKKKIIFRLACKMRGVVCHEKIQQRLLQEHSRPWRKTGLQIFHKPEYVDFVLQHIKLPFLSSPAPSSPDGGCR